MSLNKYTLTLPALWLALATGCPSVEIADTAQLDSVLQALEGTWSGTLSCYEEGASSSGPATLTLSADENQATGTITFSGSTPAEFTSTAALELKIDENGELVGEWSDCEIEGGVYADGRAQLSCHFWHQTQNNGFVIKPNLWELNEEQTILTMIEHPQVESEAQKCVGELTKAP